MIVEVSSSELLQHALEILPLTLDPGDLEPRVILYSFLYILPHIEPKSAKCCLLQESQFRPLEPPRASSRMAALQTLKETLVAPSALCPSVFFSPFLSHRWQILGHGPKYSEKVASVSVGPLLPLRASTLPFCSLESRNPVTKAWCRVSQSGSPWAASQPSSQCLEQRKPTVMLSGLGKATVSWKAWLSMDGRGRYFPFPVMLPSVAPWGAGPAYWNDDSLVLLPTGLSWRDSKKASQLWRVVDRPNYFTPAHAFVVP